MSLNFGAFELVVLGEVEEVSVLSISTSKKKFYFDIVLMFYR